MINQRTFRILFILLIGLSAVLMLFTENPQSEEIGQDTGVFLYTAKMMNEGGAPYLDSWDHKGPVVYFLNLLAYKLHPNVLWGLFFLHAILIFISTCALTFALSDYLSWGAICLGFALYLVSALRVYELDRTELYTVFFLMLSIAFYLIFERRKKDWGYLLIGMLFGMVLLMRPNNAAFWGVLTVFLLVECFQRKRITAKIIWLALGVLAVFGGTFLYLNHKGAVAAFFDQYILYNFVYTTSGNDLVRSFVSLFKGLIDYFGLTIILIVLAAYYVIIMKRNDQEAKLDQSNEFNRLINMLLISFPIELLAASMAGRNPSYYLSVHTVYFMIFLAIALDLLLKKVTWLHPRTWQQSLLLIACAGMLFFSINKYPLEILGGLGSRLLKAEFYDQQPPSYEAQFIREHTTDNDTIFVWGASDQYYILSDRNSPTRYTYMLPLFQCSYSTSEMWDEFVSDIEIARPKLIIEMRNFSFPEGEKAPKGCEHISDQVDRFFAYVSENYGLLGHQSDSFLTVFELNGE